MNKESLILDRVMPSLSFHKQSMEKYQKQYQSAGIVQIKQAFNAECIDSLYQHIAQQKQWNLVYNNAGQHVDLDNLAVARWPQQDKNKLTQFIYQQAEQGFQYFYETIPIYDIYYKGLMPGHWFNNIMEFLNSESTLNYFRQLLNSPEITFIDGQITRFGAGHFLNIHDDNVKGKNRLAAMVIQLTPNWQPDWGGALHIVNEQNEIMNSVVPEFNTINIFKIPVKHFVGVVAPFVSHYRYAITGWLRTGINPLA
jgi:Rps23 Pro-64 3,4-dihydroxylase Tpa1-like proline 4-hydroxylase